MSKILIFSFAALTKSGGLGDLRHVLENDNREGISVVDGSGYVLPTVLADLAGKSPLASRIQALHLEERGRPTRIEEWERISALVDASDVDEKIVRVSPSHSFLRTIAKLCTLR